MASTGNRPDDAAAASRDSIRAALGMDVDAAALQLGLVAVEAGRGLAAIADRHVGQHVKPDGSPCSAADLEAEHLIVARLRALWPDIPIVAEEGGGQESGGHEGAAEAHGDGPGLFFLVDPLDGTRDYLTGAGEYSVNIALVAGARPVASAVAAPASGRVWIAGTATRVAAVPASGDPSGCLPARVRPVPAAGLVALVSRRHGDPATEAVMAALPITERRTASSAYKFCLVASGEADLYVRCGPTMEWDTAAGDHVVAMAGGATIGPDHRALTYGRRDRRHLNGPFAAVGDIGLIPRLVLPDASPQS